MDILLTWVTVCSVNGTSSPCKSKCIMFTAHSAHKKTLLNNLKLTTRGTYSESHAVNNLLRVTL